MTVTPHRRTPTHARRRLFLAHAGGVVLSHACGVVLPHACGVVLAAAARGAAAQGTRKWRVGWLGWQGAVGGTASALALAAFRSGLADRGWVEGHDLELLVRNGDRPRSGELAAELVQQDVHLLVAQGPMVFGAKPVAAGRPVVFCINGDPVEAGLVSSLARPAGNLTGITALSTELAGKRVELLQAAAPGGKRLAAVANDVHPGVAIDRAATQAAARQLGLSLAWYGLQSAADLEPALDRVARDGADMLLAIPDALINGQARLLAGFAAARRVPSLSGWSEFAEAGNLMSYGPSARGYFRQLAGIADRLLRGARPADVAVEQARDLELVVNLRTARAIGLQLPAELLLRADQRIE
ncbi:MAG: ABC transporter substrate-binding protein [Proteobacteria bacterium]|nr:ABC transporter substrate-binding protein [Pseudomonadota bacterium]